MMVCSLQSPPALDQCAGYMAGGTGQGSAQGGCWVKGLSRLGRKTDLSFRPSLDPECHCEVFLCAALIYAKEVTFLKK